MLGLDFVAFNHEVRCVQRVYRESDDAAVRDIKDTVLSDEGGMPGARGGEKSGGL